MTARFDRAWAKTSRANLAASVGLLLALPTSQFASAAPPTPEQRRACTRTPTCDQPVLSRFRRDGKNELRGRR